MNMSQLIILMSEFNKVGLHVTDMISSNQSQITYSQICTSGVNIIKLVNELPLHLS